MIQERVLDYGPFGTQLEVSPGSMSDDSTENCVFQPTPNSLVKTERVVVLSILVLHMQLCLKQELEVRTLHGTGLYTYHLSASSRGKNAVITVFIGYGLFASHARRGLCRYLRERFSLPVLFFIQNSSSTFIPSLSSLLVAVKTEKMHHTRL